jgi:diguanylate cyclase (GGDEF)-like protein/PAS domain S-box-containing protein
MLPAMSATQRVRMQAAEPALLVDQLLNDAAIGLSAVDANFHFSLVNVAFAQALGRTPDQLIGTSAFDHVHPDDLAALAESAAQLTEAQPGTVSIPTPFRAKHADGTYVELEVWLQSIDRSGSPYHMVFTHRSAEPMTAIDRFIESTICGDGLDVSFAALITSLEMTFPCDVLVYWGWDGNRFSNVVGNRSELIEHDLLSSGVFVDLSEVQSSRATALQLAALTGQPIDHIDFQDYPEALRDFAQLHEVLACQVVPMRHRDDVACMVMWNRQQAPAPGHRMVPGTASRLVLERTARMGTLALQRWSNDQRLAREMRTDPLTQIMNRYGLMELLQGAEESGQVAWILIIDIDGFKAINDEHGHLVGDFALTELARRFRAALPEQGVVARLGGDEFAVFLGNAGNEPEHREQAMEALRDSVRLPFMHGETALRIDISIGAGLVGTTTGTKKALATADQNMYADKVSRRSRSQADAIHQRAVQAGQSND